MLSGKNKLWTLQRGTSIYILQSKGNIERPSLCIMIKHTMLIMENKAI